MFRPGCPDKGCERLAWKPLVIGFLCIGRMPEPTDHVASGVNDLRLCFKQKAVLSSWHINGRDMRIMRGLLDKAISKTEGGDNAVHKGDPAQEA